MLEFIDLKQMLPSFAPPYGLRTALGAVLSSQRTASPDIVEGLFAEEFRVSDAILLPSARAGICWSLKACGSAGLRVPCPVFTCTAVWEAVFRSGAEIDGIDVGEGFLVDESALQTRITGRHALILCEIYGHTYDLQSLIRRPGNQPEMRILDLAGGVLRRQLLSRLGDKDLAVVSFGRGSKAMYSGWGGMAFTNDHSLGRAIRELRASETRLASRRVSAERAVRLLLVSLLRKPTFYSMKQGLEKAWPRPARLKTDDASEETSQSQSGSPGPEFWSPMTRVERSLARHNLEHLPEHIECRRELTRRYDENLSDADKIVLPPRSGDILSHYTIRVPAGIRNEIFASLERAGIEVGRLFFFSNSMREHRLFLAPSRYCQREYPNAVQVSSEVLNLPLYPGLTADDVDWISENVRQSLAVAGNSATSRKVRRHELQNNSCQ